MRLFIWMLLCLFSGNFVAAQRANYKQLLKYQQLPTNSQNINPTFLKNSDKFWYNVNSDKGIEYYFVDPKKKRKQLLFENEHMAMLLSEKTSLAIDHKNLALSSIKFKDDERTMQFLYNNHCFEYDILSRELKQLDCDAFMKRNVTVSKYSYGTYSPDSLYVVYARKHNLYLLQVVDSVEFQLTFDGTRYNSYAANDSDTSRRNVESNARWFKDSKRLYITRIDNRKVKEISLLSVLSDRPIAYSFKYALPGDENVPQYELSVFDVETHKQQVIDSKKWKDQILSVVHVPRVSDKIYFFRKKRTCDEIDICVGDTRTGAVNVLIHEKCEPYFNEDLFYLSFLNDEQDIIWWSERTGWGHYYHYDGNGNLKNVITSGAWVAGRIVKLDTLNRQLFFEAHGKIDGQNPYYAQLCKASFDREDVKQLTDEDANHKCYLSLSKNYIVDCYSRVDMEPRVVLRAPGGEVLMTLLQPDLTRLYERGWRMPETFSVKAADGKTDLYGVMWKPFDFDSTKQYPIISHVYPGPQTESFPLDFTIGGEEMSLAQLGFVVVCFGHRGGSPIRSKAYHTFGYGNLRDYPLADDKYGIEQLADRFPFIDISRVGIYGHSGGGFMATAAICTYPDFYDAAVASAGNHDNRIFNQWWGETFHGLRVQKQTEGDVEKEIYSFQVPTNMELAKNLKGHLMLVTGDGDNIVNPGNTYRMVDALIKAGKNFELVVLPGNTHWYSRQGMYYYQHKMWFHFAKYLLGDYSSDLFSNMKFYKE